MSERDGLSVTLCSFLQSKQIYIITRPPSSALGCPEAHNHGGGLVAKSCPTLMTPWTVARQAPLSKGFSRQEYWSQFHFLLQGIFPTQGSNPGLLHCRLPW